MRKGILGQACLLALAGAALSAAWISTGSQPGLVLWWLCVVLLGVLTPGWVLTRCLRAGGVSATDLGWSGPVGLALTLATWLVGHLVGHSLPTLVVGPVVAAVLLLVPSTRRRALARPPDDGDRCPWWGWAALTATVLAAVRWMWVGGLANVAPRPTAGFQIYYQDLLYQTALTGEARRSVVPEYPMVNGEPLGYHWFFHAVAAQLSGTGADDLDVVARLLPATLVVILLLLGAAVGRQVTGDWSGALGAAIGIALVRPLFADNWVEPGISPLPSYWQLSPTATLGWVFGLAVVGCLVGVLRRRPDDARAPTRLLPAFAVGAAGAKSAQLPVIFAGVALAAIAVLVVAWRRRRCAAASLRALALRYASCLGILLVVMVLALLFLYPGSYGLRLDPSFWPTDQTRVVYGHPVPAQGAEILAMLVALVHRWVPTVLPALGLLVLVVRRPSDPAGWIGIGAVVTGVLAALVLTHPSGSQLYFPVAALPIGYALSGAAVASGMQAMLARRGKDAAPFEADARLRPAARGGPALALVGAAAAGVGVVLSVRRLLPSGGVRPEGAADVTAYAAVARAWLAPSLVALALLTVLVTAAWFLVRYADRRSPGSLLRGTWMILLVLAVAGAGVRPLVHTLDLTTDPGTPRSATTATDPQHRPAVTPALFAAGQYLRAHAAPGDVVATNRVWNGVTPAGLPDNRDFSVSALSGLRTDVGGYGYAPRLLEGLAKGASYATAPFWDQPRLEAELALVRAPDAAGLEAAYRTRGVRWIVADERSGPVSPDLARLTDVISHDDGVWLARLRPGGA